MFANRREREKYKATLRRRAYLISGRGGIEIDCCLIELIWPADHYFCCLSLMQYAELRLYTNIWCSACLFTNYTVRIYVIFECLSEYKEVYIELRNITSKYYAFYY